MNRFVIPISTALILTTSIALAETPPKASSTSDGKIHSSELTPLARYYAQSGLHRTGSKVDQRVLVWMKNQLKRDGWLVTQQTFPIQRPISKGGVILIKVNRIQSRHMPVMPLLNSSSTDGKLLKGKLGFLGDQGTIPVMHVYHHDLQGHPGIAKRSQQGFYQALESGQYPAVIGITQGGESGLAPISIDLSQHYNTVGIIASSKLGNYLEINAKIHKPIRYQTNIQYKETLVTNLVAFSASNDKNEKQSTAPKKKPIVVIVPRNSWWAGAGERGGSIAIGLALAKDMASHNQSQNQNQNQPSPIVLVSPAGSEFQNIGLKHFIQDNAALIKRAKSIIVIGKNIGAKPNSGLKIYASSRRAENQLHGIIQKMNHSDRGSEEMSDESSKKRHLVYWDSLDHDLMKVLKPLMNQDHDLIVIEGKENRCDSMVCDQWPSAVEMGEVERVYRLIVGLIKKG